MREIKIYFGISKRDGSIMTAGEWSQFVNDTLVHIIPSFTIIAATGYWKTVVEPCYLVILSDTYGDHTIRQKINDLCVDYCNKYDQECVLVTYSGVETQMYGRE